MAESRDSLRSLPAIGRLLDSDPIGALAREAGAGLVGALVREEVGRLQEDLLAGRLSESDLAARGSPEAVAGRVSRAIEGLLAPSPRTVINATGVVVHTNLGRSVLSPAAARRVAEASTRYMDLEFDREDGWAGEPHEPSRAAPRAPLPREERPRGQQQRSRGLPFNVEKGAEGEEDVTEADIERAIAEINAAIAKYSK